MDVDDIDEHIKSLQAKKDALLKKSEVPTPPKATKPVAKPKAKPVARKATRNVTKKITNPNAEIKLVFDYDGDGNGKGGLATIFIDGKEVAKGRVDKTQPAVFSADETADVGLDDATQVADKVFADLDDSKFTGFVKNVTISIPD